MRAAFYTLGCRLNQLETEALASSFRGQGFFIVPWEEGADLFVINSCTVTSKSEQKARRMVRKIGRDNPQALIILTGCYAQMEGGKLLELGDNVLVVPLDEKDLVQDLAVYLASMDPASYLGFSKNWLLEHRRDQSDPASRFRFNPQDFSFHSRAYLKVQDGCDNQCAYCRVTLARGASVSLDMAEVLRRIGALEDRGYQEVVLTGVNIDSYLSGAFDLAGMLTEILAKSRSIRIRLSSLEPQTLTEDFCRAVSHERIQPYFHMSLQSGSDSVLSAMNRHYTAKDLLDGLDGLRRWKKDPFIAADVIVGFPGEGEEDFKASMDVLRRGEFAKAHVFPYSSRPGTAAEKMQNPVASETITQRAAELRSLSRELQQGYEKRQLGRTMELLVEEQGDGFVRGLTSNYLNGVVHGSWDGEMKGRLIRVRPIEQQPGRIICEALE